MFWNAQRLNSEFIVGVRSRNGLPQVKTFWAGHRDAARNWVRPPGSRAVTSWDRTSRCRRRGESERAYIISCKCKRSRCEIITGVKRTSVLYILIKWPSLSEIGSKYDDQQRECEVYTRQRTLTSRKQNRFLYTMHIIYIWNNYLCLRKSKIIWNWFNNSKIYNIRP